MNKFYKLRFHIAGSIDYSTSFEIIKLTHQFIKQLVIEILKRNGQLIITFGAETKVKDLSLIFDYTIIEGIQEYYSSNLNDSKFNINTILYHAYESKIPPERKLLVSDLMGYDFVRIKVLPRLLSFGGKLRSMLAKNTDVLIVLGGAQGVVDIVNKCYQENKIVIPLNIELGKPGALSCIEMVNNGSLNLYSQNIKDYAMSEIAKFCLKSKLDIDGSIERVLNLVFNLIKEKEEEVLEVILRDLKSLQEKNRAIKPDEDKYSIILVEFLRRSLKGLAYFPHTQETSGKTKKGYNDLLTQGGMGELDIRIVDRNNELKHICEVFILTYLNSSIISEHLNKLFDYDVNGLPVNFIIVYSKTDNFLSLWSRYLEFIKGFDWNYPLSDYFIEDISNQRDCPAEIKITLTKHHREGIICKVYHIFVNLN